MARRLAQALGALVVTQLLLGVLNLFLLAPIAMQILHLLVADLVWIGFVLLATEALGERALDIPRADVPGLGNAAVRS